MSKFKTYGDFLCQDLMSMNSSTLTNNSKPFYWYQVKAGLETKKLVMRDICTGMWENNPKPKPILIVAPTGVGKSDIIVMLPFVLESHKVLVLTPSKVISEQLRDEFGPFSKESGFLEKTDAVRNPECLGNLVIVNAQKFGGRATTSLVHNNNEIGEDVKAFFGNFDTLIVDEGHHYPALTWKRIVAAFSQPVDEVMKKIIFLTTTPYRSNSAGETKYIWDMLDGGKERLAIEIKPGDVRGNIK